MIVFNIDLFVVLVVFEIVLDGYVFVVVVDLVCEKVVG